MAFKRKQNNSNRIPKQWTESSLGEHARIRRGASPRPIRDPKWFAHEGRGWVRISDVTCCQKYLLLTTQCLSPKGVSKSVKVNPGELILSICATIGVPRIVAVPVCIHDGFVSLSELKELNTDFAYYLLLKLAPTLAGFGQHGTQKNINADIVRKVRITLPPLPEQKAIASVLECWDRAIHKYEEKIEKKKNIKRGLMQRLLSGKQRLPGFSEAWIKARFGDVFSFLKSYAFPRSDLISEEYPECICNIHYGDIHAKYEGAFLNCATGNLIPVIKDPGSFPVDCQYLQDGDLVIADASEDFEGIGACIELQNVGLKKIVGGLHTFVARDTSGKTAEIYRGYLLKKHSLAKELRRISTGASVLGISKTNLAKVILKLPPLPEQRAIASVLSSADSEIKALEKQHAVVKEQKKYLLNNLVTGTIRLPEFCESGVG